MTAPLEEAIARALRTLCDDGSKPFMYFDDEDEARWGAEELTAHLRNDEALREALAAADHDAEMSRLFGQAPLDWPNCINADEHREDAEFAIDRLTSDKEGAA